jgi:ribosomal protein S18 acetylase RimI-like enzyme
MDHVTSVEFLTSPSEVQAVAGLFLESRPVEHNVILTLLRDRVTIHLPGRYWVVWDRGAVAGVVFQSPLDFPAAVTPMGHATLSVVVHTMADTVADLPGVIGEASTAAIFAGQWTEVTRSAATPLQGQRIYRLGDSRLPNRPPGHLRPGRTDDLELIIQWSREFAEEAGVRPLQEEVVMQRLGRRQFWIWDDQGPVSMAAHSEAMAGVTRIHEVYTPPSGRNHGYASACVGQLSDDLAGQGLQCILYTDLANPASNSIYRSLGYEAVSEVLRYRFDGEQFSTG